MIKVENLIRKYGDFTAVNDVSFEIAPGQIVGLLGHNGAGKTTIIKTLTGYLEPTSGHVTIGGHDIEDDRLHVLQRIGYLPENCPLYPEMTVISYLEYIAQLRGVDEAKREQAIREAVARTALVEKATAPIGTLSKGYRQRVGIAQAILHSPEILILDEPTSGLDPSQIGEIRSLVRELSEHATVILSTHILQEVEAVCDRVIIILRGQIALDSAIDELRETNRLIIDVDKPLADVQSVLRGIVSGTHITPVTHITSPHHTAPTHRYAIEVSTEQADVNAQIARTLVENGMHVYALHPERRDLETVFREINTVNAGGMNEQ